MNFTEIEHWSKLMDEADDENGNRLQDEIPPLSAGAKFSAPDGRVWQNVEIAYGKTGGRWCYWRHSQSEGPKIVVDSIFNGWSSFFAGMLRTPYDGHVTESIMLVKEI